MKSVCRLLHAIKKIVSVKCVQNMQLRFFSADQKESSNLNDQISHKFKIADRYKEVDSLWIAMDTLSDEHAPIELGRGFSNEVPEPVVVDSLKEVAENPDWRLHQYARSFGRKRLVTALSAFYSPSLKRKIDPLKEILVTIGAQEALFCIIFAHVNPNDEVILIEPSYDSYAPIVFAAGGKLIHFPVRLKENCTPTTSQDFYCDFNELEKLFNEKTKMFIMNNPQNPTGKVFTQEELNKMAELCKKWDVICLADEVYSTIIFEGAKMIPMATLPGMWERTITIGTIGKLLHITGWKIGWAIGPPYLIRNLGVGHSDTIYSVCNFMQEVSAVIIEKIIPLMGTEKCIFEHYIADLNQKKEIMLCGLKEARMQPIDPEGGYVLFADWTVFEPLLQPDKNSKQRKDYQFVVWAVQNFKVKFIPISSFYSKKNAHLGENYVRICFIRSKDVLLKGLKVLIEAAKTIPKKK